MKISVADYRYLVNKVTQFDVVKDIIVNTMRPADYEEAGVKFDRSLVVSAMATFYADVEQRVNELTRKGEEE
jgi:hypothetical protein